MKALGTKGEEQTGKGSNRKERERMEMEATYRSGKGRDAETTIQRQRPGHNVRETMISRQRSLHNVRENDGGTTFGRQ